MTIVEDVEETEDAVAGQGNRGGELLTSKAMGSHTWGRHSPAPLFR